MRNPRSLSTIMDSNLTQTKTTIKELDSSKTVIRGAKLWSWQKDLVSAFKNLKPDQSIVVKKCRQVGCSFTLAQILFYVAINRPKSTSIYITITNSASRKFYQDLAVYCTNSPLVEKANESVLELHFTNGSKIYFRSAESKLRGLSCRNGGILIADECAFLNSDIWTQILPFTTVSHANKLICSTPWSKNSQFYKFYEQALTGDPNYILIDTKNYDLSQFISEEQRETYRKILTPQAYRTEVLGEWLDNDSGVFGNYSKVIKPLTEIEDREPVYCGIDFSVSVGGDYTVLTGFNKDLNQVLLYTDNKTEDPVHRAEKLADIINEHPTIKKVYAETNSMGSTFISIIKKRLNNPNVLEPFTTTNTTKKDIIENLIKKINKEEITLLSDPLLDYQFAIFQLVELKHGNYTYAADAKVTNSHDDIVLATAFALKAASTNQGTYSFGSTK